MEDIIIVAAIGLGAWWLLKNRAAAQANTLTPALAVPTADAIAATMGISGASSVSGGYQTLPPGFVHGISSPASLSSYVAPPPVPPAPPPFYGGTAGTAGSGGNPLGGPLRAGVSGGTGTTSFRAPTAGTANLSATAIDPRRLAARQASQ